MFIFLIGSLLFLHLMLDLGDSAFTQKFCPEDNIDFIDYVTKYKLCNNDDANCAPDQKCCEGPCFEISFCRQAVVKEAECPEFGYCYISDDIWFGSTECEIDDTCDIDQLCCLDQFNGEVCYQYPDFKPTEPDPSCVKECDSLLDVRCLLQLLPKLCFTVDPCGATKCLSPFFSFSG